MTDNRFMNFYRKQSILADIKMERIRQDGKWGLQSHSPLEWMAILGEEFGEACQGALRAHFGNKSLDEYRAELIQVAAVAVCALENLDRDRAEEGAA